VEGLIIFAVSIITFGSIYGIVCLALNMEAGTGPLWDLGIVAYFGIGAYTYVLLTANPAAPYQHYIFGFGLPMWLGGVGAAVTCGLAAWVISIPTLRLKKEYFLIVTLAMAEVVRQLYINEDWLTNGVAGIYGLEQPLKQHFSIATYPYVLMAISLTALAIAFAITSKISNSPFGRSAKAIRENEALAITAGINLRRVSTRLYILAGAMTGVAGMIAVWYNTLIVPSLFTSNFTFFIWAALIIGGIGNVRGALMGAFIFIILHDSLRFLQVSGELATAMSSLRTALVGIVLILILRIRPQGLFPERRAIFDVKTNAVEKKDVKVA
jgi:branched-chain amino acid transport system permease protein